MHLHPSAGWLSDFTFSYVSYDSTYHIWTPPCLAGTGEQSYLPFSTYILDTPAA